MGNKEKQELTNARFPSNAEVELFSQTVMSWAVQGLRKFPWRRARTSHYRLIVTEVLLQRTRVDTVARLYLDFFRCYSSWSVLSAAPVDELEKALKPIGLYKRRAKALKSLASEMVRRNGRFPSNREEIDELPAVGQYVGNAVELFVFCRPLPLLDVNMSRLLERYFGKRKLADIRYDPYLQTLASMVVGAVGNPRKFNWALLDYASLVCKRENPLCDSCLLASKCKNSGNSDP